MAFTYISTGKQTTNVPVAEVQTINFGDISTADTFTLTYNSHTTGTITYSTDMSADILAGLVGLTDFVAGDLSVSKTSLTVYVVTFLDTGAFAGVNASAITITNASGFTPTGVTETVSGRSQFTKTMMIPGGRGYLYGVRWGLFVNGSSNELLITDASSRTIYSVTGKDTDVSSALLATSIGQDGRDQGYNAAANVLPALVDGPVTVRVRNGSGTVSPASGSVTLKFETSGPQRIVKRSTGTIATSANSAKAVDINFPQQYVRPDRLRISGFDSSTDYSIVDFNGETVFSKTALDATTALDFALGFDGEDQAGNAAADTLPGIFQAPLTATVTNAGGTTGSIAVYGAV